MKERTAELERQGEALRAARQMEAVGRLAGGIAHDFNNLLTVVMANASQLMRHPVGPEEAQPILEDVVAASARGTELVKQLLAFGRRQQLQPRTFDLNDLVREEAGLLGRLIGEHIKLEMVLDGEPLPVRADPTQVRQVLVNLVSHARDAVPDDGLVTVRTSGLSWAFTRRCRPGDTSRSPCATAGLAWMPRRRAACSSRSSPRAPPAAAWAGADAGLGLATVHGIVHQSGGSVDVESTQGRGTELRVLLPRAVAIEGAARPGSGVKPDAASTVTVLIAEDEPGVRAVMARIVKQMGHQSCSAATARRRWPRRARTPARSRSW